MSKSIHGIDGKRRFDTIDIMKGLLIILVVLGHTNTPLTKWIYSFHMAAFFAISGFLWNENCLQDKSSVLRFIKGRVKRLYLPFVAVNILFILLNNFFLDIGFYTTDAAFIEVSNGWPTSQLLSSYFGLGKIISSSIKSLFLMSGSAPLVVTCWFLSTLFELSILQLLVSFLLRKTSRNNKIIVYGILFIGCLAISFNTFTGNLPGGVKRIFPSYVAFLMGKLTKEWLYELSVVCKKGFVKAFIVVLTVIGFLLSFTQLQQINLSNGNIVTPVYYILGLFSGMVLTIHSAKLIEKTQLKEFVITLGRNSMSIMLFHFVSFKVVSLIIIFLLDKDFMYLASRPVIYDVSMWWSIPYVIVGIGIPLFCDYAIERITNKTTTNI